MQLPWKLCLQKAGVLCVPRLWSLTVQGRVWEDAQGVWPWAEVAEAASSGPRCWRGWGEMGPVLAGRTPSAG